MGGFGVYVHIPFCSVRCDYCAFATWTDREHLVDDYVDALIADIGGRADGEQPVATSVFVGGGTPSLVPGRRLAEVVAAIPRADDAEITVECNPDDVSVELLGPLVDVGVTRVSLGVQSTRAHVLAALGRHHDAGHVTRAVETVGAAGIDSFNVDMIYGAAGETIEDWEASVRDVIDLDPDHIAAYGLMVEPGTPLAGQPDRHPDDDDQADKYLLVEELLVAAGFGNYEISNWARPGHESRHNRLYWSQGDYAGVGCAAHSHRAGRRWWNVRTPERYIALVRDGASTEAAGEDLDEAERRFERTQLALRTADGVERSAFDDVTLDELDDLVEPHPIDPARVRLTVRGRLLANEVSTRLREHTDDEVSVAVGGANVRRR